MLTRAGWLTLLSAGIAALAGRLFGVLELFIVAAVLAMLVAACLAWVRLTAVRLRVSRVVSPAKVHMGEATKVEVTAINTGTTHTPVLHLSDPVAGTRGARLHLAPLAGGEKAQAAYRLPTDRRGILQVGPLGIEIADPFGLAHRRATAAPLESVTIFPHVDAIRVPSLGGDEDPHGAAIQTNKLGQTTDEFFALREYVRGDDMRRVHWKSTARSNELMVRQDETPWQDRTTVAIDVRPQRGADPAIFERAVSAAASVVSAGFRQRHLVRLVSTAGFDSGVASGLGHSETILGYLAGVHPSAPTSSAPLFDQLTRSAQGGLLVIVTSEWNDEQMSTLTRLRGDFRRIVVVGTTGLAPAGMPRGMAYVDARGELAFPAAWLSAVGRNAPRTVPA